jgi:hypothetical protein
MKTSCTNLKIAIQPIWSDGVATIDGDLSVAGLLHGIRKTPAATPGSWTIAAWQDDGVTPDRIPPAAIEHAVVVCRILLHEPQVVGTRLPTDGNEPRLDEPVGGALEG